MHKIINVLLCPLHYWFEDSGGEVGWAYEYFSHSSSVNCNVVAVVANKRAESSKINKQLYAYSTSPLTVSTLNSLFFHIRSSFAGLKIIKSQNIDIVHHFLPFRLGHTFNLLALTAVLKGRIFIVGPVQTVYEKKQPSTFGHFLSLPVAFLSKMTLAKADAVIAVNEDSKTALMGHGVKEDKISVIPPGIDDSIFKTDRHTADRQRIELITVGQLIERKAMDKVILAMNLIKRRYPEAHLTIVGDGPLRASLEEQTFALKLAANISFIGHVDKATLVNLYQNSDLYISMSSAESWGQVYVEALACGLPVVSSENSGSQAILSNLDQSLLIERGDVDSLAKRALSLLGEDKKELKRLSRLAPKAIEQYHWSKISSSYLDIYKKCLKK